MPASLQGKGHSIYRKELTDCTSLSLFCAMPFFRTNFSLEDENLQESVIVIREGEVEIQIQKRKNTRSLKSIKMSKGTWETQVFFIVVWF